MACVEDEELCIRHISADHDGNLRARPTRRAFSPAYFQKHAERRLRSKKITIATMKLQTLGRRLPSIHPSRQATQFLWRTCGTPTLTTTALRTTHRLVTGRLWHKDSSQPRLSPNRLRLSPSRIRRRRSGIWLKSITMRVILRARP